VLAGKRLCNLPSKHGQCLQDCYICDAVLQDPTLVCLFNNCTFLFAIAAIDLRIVQFKKLVSQLPAAR
jgi:hypothetical protein